MSYTVVRAVRDSTVGFASAERSRSNPGLRLVALVLATYASEDGSSVYPGLERTAAETGIDKTATSRHLEVLVRLGVLVVMRPGRRGRSTIYRFDLDVLRSMQSAFAAEQAQADAAKLGCLGNERVVPEQRSAYPEQQSTVPEQRSAYPEQRSPYPEQPTSMYPHDRQGSGGINMEGDTANRSTPPARRAAAGAATVAGGLPAGNGESAGGQVDPADIRGTPENLRKRGLPDFRGYRPAGWNGGAR